MGLWRTKAQLRKFLAWVQPGAVNMVGAEMVRWSAKEEAKAVLPVDGWAERFIDKIDRAIEGRSGSATYHIFFDENFPDGKYVLKGAGSSNEILISNLVFSHHIGELTIENSDIEVAQFPVSPHPDISVTFRNCRIRHLLLESARTHAGPRLKFVDTFVETLEAKPLSVSELEVNGGGIFNWKIPTTYQENPFMGNVSFRNVYFPRRRRDGLRLGVQAYANLRHHLKSLENWQMADVAHAFELAASREGDIWPNRALSWWYERFSQFGRSALRPLVSIVVLFSITWMVAFVTGGAVLAHPQSSGVYTGWRATLSQSDTAGIASRALVLAFQGLVNPLSIFGLRSLVVPRSGLLAVWVVLQSILSIVLIALLILAVRRRFRVR